MIGWKVTGIRVITITEDRVIVSTNRLVASLLEEGILKRSSIAVDDRIPVRVLIGWFARYTPRRRGRDGSERYAVTSVKHLVTNTGASKTEGRVLARNGVDRKVRMITPGRASSRKHSVPEGTCTDVGIVSSVSTKALVVDTNGRSMRHCAH